MLKNVIKIKCSVVSGALTLNKASGEARPQVEQGRSALAPPLEQSRPASQPPQRAAIVDAICT